MYTNRISIRAPHSYTEFGAPMHSHERIFWENMQLEETETARAESQWIELQMDPKEPYCRLIIQDLHGGYLITEYEYANAYDKAGKLIATHWNKHLKIELMSNDEVTDEICEEA